MSSQLRRTYDTDSIVLRRIYAYDISNNSPFSTSYLLTATTKGSATFLNILSSLSSVGWSNLPVQISTVAADLLSTIISFSPNYPSSAETFLPSTVIGLGTSGYISTSMLTSTVIGLGTLGYLSAAVVAGPLNSTVIGLGSSDYISSTQLFSTLEGLGTYRYISTASLFSTVEGLGSSDYVSTFSLVSTTQGLFNTQSTIQIFRSTFANLITGNFSNQAFIYSTLSTNIVSLSTIRFDIGNSLREKIIPSTTKLDIELKQNVQFSYYDGISRDYQFNSYLLRGSTFTNSNILGQESITFYVLNDNTINLPFFFQEKTRYIVQDPFTLSSIKYNPDFTTLSLHHTFGPPIPTTNQFFASPASSICATVVLDNTSR